LLERLRRPPSPASLALRLQKIARVFAIDAIRLEDLNATQVVAYYEECSSAYRKHHSAEGAMHMAINGSDRYDPKGFYAQLDRIAQPWHAEPPREVLELGFGQGFNLAYLAAKFPATRFAGIDLTPLNRSVAQQRLADEKLTNVMLSEGDFQRLPHADASFDHCYAIEAFCYAKDMRQAFTEIARVLRPGGTFSLFDGYLPRRPETLSAEEALAAELVARGVALVSFQVVDDVLGDARRAGFDVMRTTSLDQDIMPNLRRLERLTGAIIRFPWFGRKAIASRPPLRSRNVLCGYLMHSTVALGILTYRELMFRKSATRETRLAEGLAR
jgi:SAM-dependent methyltransferase